MTNDITNMIIRTVIIHRSNAYGDCVVCWEPMNLEIDVKTKEQTLICSNKQFCKHKEKVNIKFNI